MIEREPNPRATGSSGTLDLVVRARRVVLPDGIRPAAVGVEDGVVVEVLEGDAGGGPPPLSGRREIDAGDAAVLPGGVDTHVHVDDPGRAEWEGWETATRAAAAGGVTTLVDMPLNAIPPTVDAAALEAKRVAARDRAWVDYGLWGGVVPGDLARLVELAEAGALGFKAFLVPSGVPEFPAVDAAELERAMAALAAAGLDLPVLVHAESPARIDAGFRGRRDQPYREYLASRPVAAEVDAVEAVAGIVRRTAIPAHVVHVAAAAAADAVDRARREGVPLTAETCPHYLTFAAEEIPDGATVFKCAPPIRESAEREALWDALEAGTLDLVASDHSPCPPGLKREADGDFGAAWGGIAGLELARSALWTGLRARGGGLEDLARWTSAAPARLAGLEVRKGAIAPGRDADLVVWDAEASFEVRSERLRQRHPITPYAGRRLHGIARTTILRGRIVFEGGRFVGPPAGRFLGRAA